MLVTISYKIQAVNHPLCPPWKLKIVLMTEPKVNRRTPKGYKDQGQHLATEKSTRMSLSETLVPMETNKKRKHSANSTEEMHERSKGHWNKKLPCQRSMSTIFSFTAQQNIKTFSSSSSHAEIKL